MDSFLRALVFSALALVGGLPANAQGINPAVQAYAWANDSQAATYTPASDYSYNATGGATTATRSGTGTYRMTFAGVDGVGGNVQVTAYNSNARCYATGWSGTSIVITIECVNGTTLNPVDSPYTVLFTRQVAGTPSVRYAWADQESSLSYSPNAFYAYNAGSAVTATSSAVGTYRVTFANVPGAATTNNNVQVTPYGSTNRCVAVGWGASAGGGLAVTVNCYAGASLSDTKFTVLYTEGGDPGSLGAGFAYAFNPTNASYTPSYAFANGGGAITATRSGTGAYTIRFNGLGSNGFGFGGHTQVTAYGGSGYCTSAGWGSSVPYVEIDVSCFDGAGAPADHVYTVLFVWPNRMTTAAEVGPNDETFSLRLAGANPTATRTVFAVTLAEPTEMSLSMYDALGREVASVPQRAYPAGTTEQEFNSSALPAGVYTARVVGAGSARSVRFTVAR